MKQLITILLALLVLITITSGCKSTVPVSHMVEKTDSTDRQTNVKEINSDSSYYHLQQTQKKLEAARADLHFTRDQLVDMLEKLKTMPKGTTIFKTDPKLQATISIMLDSLDGFRFRCESAERIYNETIITQSRTIKQLRDSLSAQTKQSITTEKTVEEPKETIWEMLDRFLKHGLLWLVFIVIGLIVWALKRK